MAQAAIVDKCDLCESEDHVDYFCVNCQEILCKSCKLSHSKSKKTRKDQIISLSQARHDDLFHKSITVYCSEHPTVEITLFCLQCHKLICTQCIADEHNGHNISSLDKIRDSKVEKLQKLIKTLKEKKAVYENAFDIQGQAHSRFLKSIDKVEKQILNQKAKIIEKLDVVCKEQFLELKQARQNEEKQYSGIINEIQAHNQAVTSAIQTAQNSIDSNNTALIVQATAETTNTLQGLEDPTTPPTTIATYQTGDRSHPTICNVQGKVNIQQKTDTYQHSGHPDIPPVLGKANTELGTKPKLMTDVRKVKLQEQKKSGGNKQQQHPDVNKPRIDVDKVRVRSTVKVKCNSKVFCIVPLENKTAWVKCDDDEHLTLINSAGKIISKSVSLDSEICDVKLYRNELLVTCYGQCTINKMSARGKSPSTFSELSPYYAQGLCVTQDQGVMVCLWRSYTDNKVVRLNTAGNVTQTIQYDVTGIPLYSNPYSVTSLATGEVIVVDNWRVVGVDSKGGHLFTWKVETRGRKRITHDSNNNVFVTDYYCSRVYVLGKDGSEMMCLFDSTQGIEEPCGISVDNTGKLWVGCRVGNIHIIEY